MGHLYKLSLGVDAYHAPVNVINNDKQSIIRSVWKTSTKLRGTVEMDTKDLKTRYQFGLIFFAFFITVMLLQLLAYVVWGRAGFINGFWFTIIFLGMGFANLVTIIHQRQLRRGWTPQDEAERRKRLNRWWAVFLGLAVVWLIAVWFILPGIIPDLSRQLTGMLAAIWLVLAAISFVLYVIRYPQGTNS